MAEPAVICIDHVQVAAPAGCEPEARRFYGGLLGLPEIEKPAPLAGRGGAWFACGPQELHVGVAEDFAPARKAHPALRVEPTALGSLADRLRAAGAPVETTASTRAASASTPAIRGATGSSSSRRSDPRAGALGRLRFRVEWSRPHLRPR